MARRILGLSLLVLAWTAFPTRSAFAQTPAELAEARTHYQAGEKKFKAADFEAALKEFRAAEAVKTTPHAARYIGLCADKLGRYSEAAGAFERFLSDVPPKLESERETIQARVAAIKAMPGTLVVTTHPTDAQVQVDGAPAVSAPHEFSFPAGRHVLKVTADGWKTNEQEVNVRFASKQDLMVRLERAEVAKVEPKPIVVPPVAKAPEPAPVVPVEHKEPKSLVPVIVTGSIAGAAIITGTVFGVLALGDASKFKDTPTNALADSSESKALVADLCFGLALTFGVTSAVLYLTRNEDAKAEADSGKSTSQARITPVPMILPTGGGAGAVVRF